MPSRCFQMLLEANWEAGLFLCIGLDSDLSRLPKGETQLSFNKAIIEATHDLVAAYKPNVAFYEAAGIKGLRALKKTIDFIHEKSPTTLVILDAKRADIGNTNRGYARSAFEELRADAITLNPYLGGEALNPFLDYKDKGNFILCRTSNPSAEEFQDLKTGDEPLYLKVAKQVANHWNKNNNCGLVIGATYPEALKKVREVAPDLPFLVPGVGSQGGDLQQTLLNGLNVKENGLIINLSRSVIFASQEGDFANETRQRVVDILSQRI